MPKIKSIICHKMLNSRGAWTIETRVELSNGAIGTQTVPDGASKGEREAVSVPVIRALELIPTVINAALEGENPEKQEIIDNILIAMDGTPNKKHLGGNSILSVSLAVAKAVAVSKNLELYEYLRFLYSGKAPKAKTEKLDRKKLKFPTPVFNVINGGRHANNGLSFQEFMIIPAPKKPFDKQMEIGVKIYDELKQNLVKKGFSTNVGDEGGFAPSGLTVEKALDMLKLAASKEYILGKDLFLGMDVAAESFFRGDHYFIKEQGLKLNQEDLLDFYKKLFRRYPLIYIEDPYYENDIKGWKMFYKYFCDKLMVVADDLVVTNPKYLKTAITGKLANAAIVKPNQVGTLTETLNFIRLARENNMSLCVSHRSGDTAEDTFIADLALAVEAEFIKSGAPVRGERVAKYNRLLEVFSRR